MSPAEAGSIRILQECGFYPKESEILKFLPGCGHFIYILNCSSRWTGDELKVA